MFYCSLILSVIIFIGETDTKLVPKKAGILVKQKPLTSKWTKRDIGLADTMTKKSMEQERVEYSNAHLQSLHTV